MKRKVFFGVVSIMAAGMLTSCGKANEVSDIQPSTEAVTETITQQETEKETESRYTATYTYDLDKNRYPISEETKAMLIKQLTGLKLDKEQKFDFSCLTFKENEQNVAKKMKSVLAGALYTSRIEGDILICDIDHVQLESIEDLDTGLVFNFKQGNRYKFNTQSISYGVQEFLYSKYPIPDDTKSLLVSKLDGLTFEKGQELDISSLFTVSDEIMKSVIYKYDHSENGDVQLTDEEKTEYAKFHVRNIMKQFLDRKGLVYKSGSSDANILVASCSEVRLNVKSTDEKLIIIIKSF